MDDYLKMKHKNSKGLPAKKKFALQLLFAALVGFYLLWPSLSQAIHFGHWFSPPAVNYGDYFFPFKKGVLFNLGGAGVILAFNQICQQMKKMHSPRRLNEIATKLGGEFGVDFGLLVRILPNVCVLSPEFASFAAAGEKGMNASLPIQDTINIRSVSFTLLRFVRAVSRPRHPITVSCRVVHMWRS